MLPFPLVLDSVPFPNPIIRKYSFESNESVEELDCNKEVIMINHKFAEAREEIDIAMEKCDMFEGILAKLPESQRVELQRLAGLKIEMLKAELHQLDD
ncbi:hypothetical protein ACB092_01G179600 [Castanea dentata]